MEFINLDQKWIQGIRRIFPVIFSPCENWKHIADDTKPETQTFGFCGFRQRVCKVCGYQWREDGCGLYETLMPDGRTPYKGNK